MIKSVSNIKLLNSCDMDWQCDCVPRLFSCYSVVSCMPFYMDWISFFVAKKVLAHESVLKLGEMCS